MTGCCAPNCLNRSGNSKAIFAVPRANSAAPVCRRLQWFLRMRHEKSPPKKARLCEVAGSNPGCGGCISDEGGGRKKIDTCGSASPSPGSLGCSLSGYALPAAAAMVVELLGSDYLELRSRKLKPPSAMPDEAPNQPQQQPAVLIKDFVREEVACQLSLMPLVHDQSNCPLVPPLRNIIRDQIAEEASPSLHKAPTAAPLTYATVASMPVMQGYSPRSPPIRPPVSPRTHPVVQYARADDP
ncbi:hypothetical protein HPB51_021451 [Rhipicephalus microplus]|uniref:Uncharacterized protein n=1 Tax=Rhipicephalus microplus TaxID=6941 RepID=A0A9J6DWH4_RHIMP|nr:hypothetical protein HPB51_021451 [Rhipicephalus microplus]